MRSTAPAHGQTMPTPVQYLGEKPAGVHNFARRARHNETEYTSSNTDDYRHKGRGLHRIQKTTAFRTHAKVFPKRAFSSFADRNPLLCRYHTAQIKKYFPRFALDVHPIEKRFTDKP
jgi:hypothetical protein